MKVNRNPAPNPNSKTQQQKAEFSRLHPIQYVGCSKCGKTNVTLYKVEGKYYCKDCKPVEKEEKQ